MSSAGNPNWLIDQLPVGMLADDFLVRFAGIFQEVADTLVDSVDSIDAAVDLAVAPEEFVRWLGSWIAAHPNPGAVGQLPGDLGERAWIRAQTRTLAGRGTRPALELMLEQVCGGGVRVSDGGGVHLAGQCPSGDPAWVQVELPELGPVPVDDVLALIRAEVPVQVAVHLLVDGHPVSPAGADAEAEADTGTTAGEELSASIRRLPGTAGRAGVPFRSCWACAERNPVTEHDCRRCAAAPTRPVPVPDPLPAPAPVWLAPAADFEPPRTWPLVVAGVLAVLLLVALIAGLMLS